MKEQAALYTIGEVLLLLTPLQELPVGLYVIRALADDWAVLREVIDEQETERLIVQQRDLTLPVTLLEFFMPVGIYLTASA